jgi:hypothetical protein
MEKLYHLNKAQLLVWFSEFRKNAPILYKTLVLLLLLECGVIFIAPLVIPRTWYLYFYLDKKARESTQLFLRGKAVLIPDETAGWKNRPDVEQGNWVIDSNGSRSTHSIKINKEKPIRILFLGSSMINGGMGVSNNETISAFLESPYIETLNFGTMMYSLDQCLLAYRHNLYAYNPEIVVVGLDGFPLSGLKNLFIPFLNRDEIYMPYLKPRFRFENGKLQLIQASPTMLATMFRTHDLLDYLREYDFFYHQFETYRRLGQLPFSNAIRVMYTKISNLTKYVNNDSESNMLTEALMTEIVMEVSKNGSEVIFLALPDQATFSLGGLRRYLPDLYGQSVRSLRLKGFPIVDAREIFHESGRGADELFEADHKHYKPIANHLIAEKLCTLVTQISQKNDNAKK